METEATLQANEAQRIADQKAKEQVAMQIARERLRFIMRQIEASERATAKALEILNQPYGECTPPEAARLLAVGNAIGASMFGLQGTNLNGDLQPIGVRQVTNIVVTRDEQSLKVMRIYSDFFRQHPEHPQAERYIREYEEECQARGLPLDWQPDGEQQELSDGEPKELPGGEQVPFSRIAQP